VPWRSSAAAADSARRFRYHPVVTTPAQNRSLILWAVVLLVLSPVVFCEFTTWDDDSTVSRNSRLDPPTLAKVGYYWTHQAGSLYIPVTYTVWSVLAVGARLQQRDVSGIVLNPMVFHAANLLIHAGSAALVMSILNRLTRNRDAALIGALLFAIHPVQVEAVAWISGLKDLLWGFFSLAAIDLYLQVFSPAKEQAGAPVAGAFADNSATSPPFHLLKYLAGTVCVALAMLSKPTAVMTPLIVVAMDRLLLVRPWKKIAISAGPWIALSVPCAIIARVVQPGFAVQGDVPWARPLVMLDSIAFYVGKLLWPANLTPDYGHRPSNVVADGLLYWTWIVPAVLFAIAAWQFKRRRWIAAGLAVFILGTLPTIGLTSFSFQFFSTTADHYLYVSMLGVAIVVAFVLAQQKLTPPLIGACAVVLLALAVRTFGQTAVWKDTDTVLKQMSTVNPRSFIAPYMLGQLEVDARHYAAAEPLLRRSLEMEPRYPRPHDALAEVLLNTGRQTEAIPHIQQFIKAVPNLNAEIAKRLESNHVNLGIYYAQHGDKPQAAHEFREALKLNPGDKTIEAMLKKCETNEPDH